MDTKKGEGVRFAGTGRFVTVVPKKPMTPANIARVHEALSSAAEQTGTFRTTLSQTARSSTSKSYGSRKLPPKKS